MRGKIAFVLGAAVGYVLGTRAGRERYEQIKRGAEAIWNTEPVQQGVGVVRGIVDDRADDLKAFVRRATADAFSNLSRQASGAAKASRAAADAAAAEEAAPAKPKPRASTAAKKAPAKKAPARSSSAPKRKPAQRKPAAEEGTDS